MSSKHGAICAPSTNYLRRPDAIIRAILLRGAPDVVSFFLSSGLIGRDIRLVQYSDGAAFRTLNYARGRPGDTESAALGTSTKDSITSRPGSRSVAMVELSRRSNRFPASALKRLMRYNRNFFSPGWIFSAIFFLVGDGRAHFKFARDGRRRRRI